MSMSLSLLRTLPPVVLAEVSSISSFTLAVSSAATGLSLVPLIVIVSVAVSVLAPSETRNNFV